MVATSKHQQPSGGKLSKLGKYTIRLDWAGDHIVVICTRFDSTTVYRRSFINKEIDQANECFNDVKLLAEISITLERRVHSNRLP